MSRDPPTVRLLHYLINVPLLFLLLIGPNSSALAQSTLESPTQGSFESGIGLIRGWVCEATRVEISIDGGSPLLIAYGTARADTRGVCGDDNNGFGLTVNWSTLRDGLHNLRALADGIEFANVNFIVTTLGENFLRDITAEYTVMNFPDPGNNVTIRWSEPHQSFVFASATAIPDIPNPPGHPRATLESPSQGSAESGIGLIRGWACEAERIEISIDGGSLLLIAYGTVRADTRGVCGDDDNGFGFTVNWNTIGEGVHNLRAFADDVEFANVNFAVTTLRNDDPFLTEVNGQDTLPDFPRAGENVTVRWSEPHQNFTIVSASVTGAKIATVAAITDLLNPYLALALGNNNSTSIGVQGQGIKAGDGRARQLTAITFADLNGDLIAHMPLGNNGLPMVYRDSNGIKAEFSNFTQTTVDISIFDSTDNLISGPSTRQINGSLLFSLQQLALSVQTPSQLQAQRQGIKRSTLAAAAAAPLSLDTLRLNAVFAGGVAIGEVLCTLAGDISIAATACAAPLISGFANLAGAGSGIAPEVQRALRFTEDVTDTDCDATLDEGTGCLTEAARQVREREDPSPGLQVPAAPTGVNATDGAFTDRVRIIWDSVSGATSYQVFRSNSTTDPGVQLTETGSNTFDDIAVTPGNIFSYRVKACNSAGCSTFSSADSGFAEAMPEPLPSAPTGVTASDGTFDDRIEISWNPAAGATFYEVYRSDFSEDPGVLIDTSMTTSLQDTFVELGEIYWYRVRACNAIGCSEFSNPDSGNSSYSIPTFMFGNRLRN